MPKPPHFGIFHSPHPNRTPLRTIRTNINLIAPLQQLSSKLLIFSTLPECFKARLFQVAESVSSILVEAAGDDHAIPCDDARMPELPAMVQQFIFHLP